MEERRKSNRCSVCRHEKSDEIIRACLSKKESGKSYAQIAAEFGVEKHNLTNCFSRHEKKKEVVGLRAKSSGALHATRCKVCRSKLKAEIEERILAGDTPREIVEFARAHGEELFRDSLRRHMERHFAEGHEAMREITKERVDLSREGLVSRARGILAQYDILKSYKEGDISEKSQRAMLEINNSHAAALQKLHTMLKECTEEPAITRDEMEEMMLSAYRFVKDRYGIDAAEDFAKHMDSAGEQPESETE